MMSTNALDSALSGMQAASALFNVAASNIANLNTPAYQARQDILSDVLGSDEVSISSITTDPSQGSSFTDDSGDGSDDGYSDNDSDDALASDLISLSNASTLYDANADVIITDNQMTGSLLDVMASEN